MGDQNQNTTVNKKDLLWDFISKNKKKIVVIGGIIFGVMILVFAIFQILKFTGKNSIYGKATSEKPKFGIEASASDGDEKIEELVIDPDSMELESETAQEVQSESMPEQMEQIGMDQGEEESQSQIIAVENEEGYVIESDEENVLDNIHAAPEGADYDIEYEGKKYAYNTDMINLLVMGIDNLKTVSPAVDGISGGQSDAMFLLCLNPRTMVMDIVAIPRDTITKIDIYDRSGAYVQSGYAQICLQHGYGDGMEISNQRAKKVVQELFYDLPIHSVTSINMGAIPNINDAIGGITLNSLDTFSDEGWNFTAGQEVHLEGKGAYSYIHYRDTSRHYTAPERLERQKQYITLFIDRALAEIRKNVGTVVDIYTGVQDYVVTDLNVSDMTYLGSEMTKYTFGGIYSLEGTVDTSRKYERYYLDKNAFAKILVQEFYEQVG